MRYGSEKEMRTPEKGPEGFGMNPYPRRSRRRLPDLLLRFKCVLTFFVFAICCSCNPRSGGQKRVWVQLYLCTKCCVCRNAGRLMENSGNSPCPVALLATSDEVQLACLLPSIKRQIARVSSAATAASQREAHKRCADVMYIWCCVAY